MGVVKKRTPTSVEDVLLCRDGEIRTLALVVPNDARYLAALHPGDGMGLGVGMGVHPAGACAAVGGLQK